MPTTVLISLIITFTRAQANNLLIHTVVVW